MPHKINPIRFENAEANFELSSALLDSLAATLVTSRLQRDLTDSTTQRNVGVALGHSLARPRQRRSRACARSPVDTAVLDADLDSNWEVLGEAIQTVIRAEVTAGRSSIADPYAILKELTRGKRIGQQGTRRASSTDSTSATTQKPRLRELTPGTYIGLASDLVDYLD